jgi:hemoglobin
MEAIELQYGVKDASYITAGKLEGITTLVNAFYSYMDTVPEAKHIREMHPEDIETSREKLRLFLCGWLGGPKLYQEKFGPISIPKVHLPFQIGATERDAWLSCMEMAIADQDYPESFKTYLLKQLFIPAERVREVSEKNHNG